MTKGDTKYLVITQQFCTNDHLKLVIEITYKSFLAGGVTQHPVL